jgi:hypothetical protein
LIAKILVIANQRRRKILENFKTYYSVDSKIMLTWNINVDYGLVNGATGELNDILFQQREGRTSFLDDLPFAFIVQFDNYSGSQFFEDPQKFKWVPIFPQTAKWFHGNT